jgi:hypothetical protein
MRSEKNQVRNISIQPKGFPERARIWDGGMVSEDRDFTLEL